MRLKAMQPVIVDGFGIDPAAWFKAMTSKIDLMRDVDQKLATDLIASSEQLKQSATCPSRSSLVSCCADSLPRRF